MTLEQLRTEGGISIGVTGGGSSSGSDSGSGSGSGRSSNGNSDSGSISGSSSISSDAIPTTITTTTTTDVSLTEEQRNTYTKILPELAVGYASVGVYPKALSALRMMHKFGLTIDIELSKQIFKGFLRESGGGEIRQCLRVLLSLRVSCTVINEPTVINQLTRINHNLTLTLNLTFA